HTDSRSVFGCDWQGSLVSLTREAKSLRLCTLRTASSRVIFKPSLLLPRSTTVPHGHVMIPLKEDKPWCRDLGLHDDLVHDPGIQSFGDMIAAGLPNRPPLSS